MFFYFPQPPPLHNVSPRIPLHSVRLLSSPLTPLTQKLTSSRQLRIPFPTERLASTALKSISVDPELSGLVRRTFAVSPSGDGYTLDVDYSATTNRMLRVAVNSFMDSLRLVVEVMEQLDEDVLRHAAAAGETK